MNGFSTEEDSRDSGHGQICCLVEDGQRCQRSAGKVSEWYLLMNNLKISIDARKI